MSTPHPTAASHQIDLAAVEFGQLVTAVALAVSFVTDVWVIAAGVGLVNLIGSRVPALSVMSLLYRTVGRRIGIHPRIVADDPTPHRFAQMFSGVVTICGAATVAVGADVLGWALALLVAGLAVLNIAVGFCAGCFTYHQLQRLGLIGRAA